MRIVVAISGASGVIYGVRLLEELNKTDIETHLVISKTAEDIIKHETTYTPETLERLADYVHEENDLNAIVNSGSFHCDTAIIVPCSMKTLSSISNAYADNTITRVADVALKEQRRLIIVPRETPLRTKHLENMTSLSREGAIILPAMSPVSVFIPSFIFALYILSFFIKESCFFVALPTRTSINPFASGSNVPQ